VRLAVVALKVSSRAFSHTIFGLSNYFTTQSSKLAEVVVTNIFLQEAGRRMCTNTQSFLSTDFLPVGWYPWYEEAIMCRNGVHFAHVMAR
jgi:hypothetical protein